MILLDTKFYINKIGFFGTLLNTGYWAIFYYRVGHFFIKSKYRNFNPFWYVFIIWYNIFLKFSKIEISFYSVIGKKLFLPHPAGLVIGVHSIIGDNCTISQGVIIGHNGISNKMPRIGNNVYIAPHAVIVGDIYIGNNSIIGANSVLTKSIPDKSIVSVSKALSIRQQKPKSIKWDNK